jgi:hypothetical protein
MVKITYKDIRDLVNTWTSVDANDWTNIIDSGAVNSGAMYVDSYGSGSNVNAKVRSTINLQNCRLVSFSFTCVASGTDSYTSGSQDGSATIRLTDGSNNKTIATCSVSLDVNSSESACATRSGSCTLYINNGIVTFYIQPNGGAGCGSTSSASQSGVVDGDTQDISAWAGCYLEIETTTGTRISAGGTATISNFFITKKLIGSKGTLAIPS